MQWNYDTETQLHYYDEHLNRLGHRLFDYRKPDSDTVEYLVRRLKDDASLSLLAVANGTDGGEILIKPVQPPVIEIAQRSGREVVSVYMLDANISVDRDGLPSAMTQPRYIIGEPFNPSLSTKAIQRGTEEFIKVVGRPLLADALAEAGLIKFLP